jgi:hydrogenase-1 operon protein HyaF
MSGLNSIPVRVEAGADTAFRTENLRPLLLQIEQALQALIGHASETVIDLGAMPFSAQDERDLRDLLGRGEVRATIDAFGPSLVEETACPGVWLVEHQDAERRRLTLQLEITRIPKLLVTPRDDLADSLAALNRLNAPDAPTEDVK